MNRQYKTLYYTCYLCDNVYKNIYLKSLLLCNLLKNLSFTLVIQECFNCYFISSTSRKSQNLGFIQFSTVTVIEDRPFINSRCCHNLDSNALTARIKGLDNKLTNHQASEVT